MRTEAEDTGSAVVLLTRLEGQWHLWRTIEDRRAGTRAQFDGIARLRAVRGGIDYHETGQLTVPGQAALAAERRYCWRSEGRWIDVAFGDGRPFHRIDADLVRPAARHFCEPDIYDVVYDFSAEAAWHAVWDVRGPRKDYRMVGLYTRT